MWHDPNKECNEKQNGRKNVRNSSLYGERHWMIFFYLNILKNSNFIEMQFLSIFLVSTITVISM